MGTNYYQHPRKDDEDTDIHLGKTSAAGGYCYPCRRTMSVGGEAQIHSGHAVFYKTCPDCGGLPESCMSFTWGVDPGLLESVTEVVDEYGKTMTIQEFITRILERAPIRFFDLIGIDFC